MDRSAYELEFEDTFDSPELDPSRWLPYYLPHWSSREVTATRYDVGGGSLRLRIDEGQPPWCPEFDGDVVASLLQTGLFAGPVGSGIGQLHFRDDLVVREEQRNVRLYTPTYALIELRCKAIADPRNMVALWLMGYEDEPERSGEILVCEIFGRDLEPDSALVGMGLRPFGDPGLTDEFSAEPVAIDATEFHTYAVEWTPDGVEFTVDDQLIKTSRQSPDYPMQLMLGVYEFEPGGSYPKLFEVDYVRGYRRRA
jgi:hypothetical protein